MSLWIKICANTNLEDARLAAELGVDAVGFVFGPSKRRVTVEQVAAIVPRLPRGLEKIGVFVDASFEEIGWAVEESGLTGVQLHFEAPQELAAQLHSHFGPELRIVRTVHFVAGEPAPQVEAIDADLNIDAVLVDSKTATESGGTGTRFDWSLAAATLFRNGSGQKRIAAGGLTPENVGEAIRVLDPWGVDVASGVEAAPGCKEAAKLRAFIENARAATRERIA